MSNERFYFWPDWLIGRHLLCSLPASVDKYGSQYKGGSQHDAQEFLLWLLDKVHEELNMATKKKYKQIRNTPGRPDDVLAAEALANYARCNNSFVVDIFQAVCCCRSGNIFTYLPYRTGTAPTKKICWSGNMLSAGILLFKNLFFVFQKIFVRILNLIWLGLGAGVLIRNIERIQIR